MSELSASLVYVYRDGERIEFTQHGKLVREQIIFDDVYTLILHQQKRIICSDAVANVQVPAGYRLEIDARVKDLFLETNRPCDCTDCHTGFVRAAHARRFPNSNTNM